jgi:hypothetical protein
MLQRSLVLFQILSGLYNLVQKPAYPDVEPPSLFPDLEVLISEFAKQDANACDWAFSELENTQLPAIVLGSLAPALYNLSCSSLKFGALGASQRLLIQILECRPDSLEQMEAFSFLGLKRSFFGRNTQPPSLVETGIRLWSLLLNMTCKKVPWSKELASEVHCLLRSIRPLIDASHVRKPTVPS